MPGISHAIGIPFSRTGISWSSYWSQQKSLEYTSRSGLSLLETKSGDSLNATILPSAGVIDGTNYALRTVANFGAVASGYVEIRFYYPVALAANCRLWSSADEATALSKIFALYVASGKPSLLLQNVPTFSNTVQTTSLELTVGWHTIRWISSGGKYSMVIDGTTYTVGTGLSMPAGLDDGKWMDQVPGRDNVGLGVLKGSTAYYGNLAYIDYVDFNGTNKWICHGSSKYIYDIIGGAHMTWTGAAHVKHLASAGSYLLDTGYSIWTKTGEVNEYVPYASANTPYDPSAFLVGYVKYKDYPGSSIKFNMAPALIGFNESSSADSKLEIFDRSNTTRQSATSRASAYYDSTSLATKSRYHSIELDDMTTLKTYFNAGYQYRIFPEFNTILTPTLINGISVLSANLANKYIQQAYVTTKNPLDAIFYGDSITRGGLLVDLTLRFSTLVSVNKELREVNNGVDSSPLQTATPPSGTSFESIYASITYDYSTKYLFLCYGVQDCYLASLTSAGFNTLLGTVLTTLIANGIPKSAIVILSPFYIFTYGAGDEAKLLEIRAYASARATEFGVKYIDVYANMVANGGHTLLEADDIHPTQAGYDVIADYLIAQLT